MTAQHLPKQKFMYMGSVDDKVIQYLGITRPNKQFQWDTFFSVLSGDPLMVNDAYLLFPDWGWKQILDKDSVLRRLNRAGHVKMLKRDAKKPSEWIPEQAEKVPDIKKLWNKRRKEVEKLDEAWQELESIAWPDLNLQEMMRKQLQSENGQELLRAEGIAKEKCDEHQRQFQELLARKLGVRSAWERALKTASLRRHERKIMMEFANEVYQACFACGYSEEKKLEVGVAGYGRRLLCSYDAYKEEKSEALLEFLSARSAFEKIRAAATVRVSSREEFLFDSSRLTGFLESSKKAKAAYKASVEKALDPNIIIRERVDFLKESVSQYADAIRKEFATKESPVVLRVFDLMRSTSEAIEQHRFQVGVVTTIAKWAISSFLPMAEAEEAVEVLSCATDSLPDSLPCIMNVGALGLRNKRKIDLLEKLQASSYNLSMDPSFVQKSTDGINLFNPRR